MVTCLYKPFLINENFKIVCCSLGILAVGFKKYGSYEKLEESPIKHLLEVNNCNI